MLTTFTKRAIAVGYGRTSAFKIGLVADFQPRWRLCRCEHESGGAVGGIGDQGHGPGKSREGYRDGGENVEELHDDCKKAGCLMMEVKILNGDGISV